MNDDLAQKLIDAITDLSCAMKMQVASIDALRRDIKNENNAESGAVDSGVDNSDHGVMGVDVWSG